jgi:hypothetical protein
MGPLRIGSVIRDSLGKLYGAAYEGGDTSDPACSAAGGCGVVFRLDPWGNYTGLSSAAFSIDAKSPSRSSNFADHMTAKLCF